MAIQRLGNFSISQVFTDLYFGKPDFISFLPIICQIHAYWNLAEWQTKKGTGESVSDFKLAKEKNE